jgi:transmembrane sensor
MTGKERYILLLKKHISGTLTMEEHNELFKMTSDQNVDDYLTEQIANEWANAHMDKMDYMLPQVSEEILGKIMRSEKTTDHLIHSSRSPKILYKWLAAAVMLGLILLGVQQWNSSGKSELQDSAVFTASIPINTLMSANNSFQEKEVKLEDGTIVILKPSATLRYPIHFSAEKREIYLTGEAFFKVSRNPGRPFLVYYNNIVTQVLGTSFIVKTNSETRKVEIVVLTGKVQVYENKKLLKVPNAFNKDGVIVTANQKALYDIDHRSFEATLADELIPIRNKKEDNKEDIKTNELVFSRATSLKEIFSLLEVMYGVDILVENENIYNCVFAGDLSQQSVYNKLKIICLTVDASYEINGTRILIRGKGCI